ncbi:unnamed protein product, partial [Hapterophycus canaliculatus]
LDRRLPKPFHHVFLRVREARIANPDKNTIRKLAQLETLRGVHIYSAEVDADDLKFIDESNTLTSLALINCRLSTDAITKLANHQPLRQISLRGCPLSNLDARALDRLPHLKAVDLSRTGLKLSKLNQPGWAKTVERLQLSRPTAGQEDSLSIDGWMKLTSLHLHRIRRKIP